jgi:hypothetical protein
MPFDGEVCSWHLADLPSFDRWVENESRVSGRLVHAKVVEASTKYWPKGLRGLSLLVVPFDLVSAGQPLIPDILISATVMQNAREVCLLETFSRFGSAFAGLRH